MLTFGDVRMFMRYVLVELFCCFFKCFSRNLMGSLMDLLYCVELEYNVLYGVAWLFLVA